MAKNLRFVINTIAYVPSDDELSDSDSDCGIDSTYGKQHGSAVAKYIKTGTAPYRVKFDDFNDTVSFITGDDYPQVEGAESLIVEPFLTKLEESGFEEEDQGQLGNLSVSISLNRPLSLSEKKNKALYKEFESDSSGSKITHEKIGFFWNYEWRNSYGSHVSYEKVRDFYKRLKKKNPDKAEEFREENEKISKLKEVDGDRAERQEGALIPYQILREYGKSHENTKSLVKDFREEDGTAIIYFSFVDCDTVNFNGIYSAYLRIYDAILPPTVMSTGYEFREEKSFEIASQIDRKIRVATAKHMPKGVYYPEPNFCVLLPDKDETLPESFIDNEVGNPKGSCESAALLRQVVKRPNSIFIFSEDKPLITAIPVRTKYNKLKKIIFSETFDNDGIPLKSDLGFLTLINQSHYNVHNWCNNLYINRAFERYGNKYFNINVPAIYSYFAKGIENVGKLNAYKTDLKDRAKLSTAIIEEIVAAAEERSITIAAFEELAEVGDAESLKTFLEYKAEVIGANGEL